MSFYEEEQMYVCDEMKKNGVHFWNIFYNIRLAEER